MAVRGRQAGTTSSGQGPDWGARIVIGIAVVLLVPLFGLFIAFAISQVRKSPDERLADQARTENRRAERERQRLLLNAAATCQVEVERRLTAPSPAKFVAEEQRQRFDENTGTAYITGAVDTQNSFGAMIRTRYGCRMARKGEGWSTEVGFER